jgi:hypothetical protein
MQHPVDGDTEERDRKRREQVRHATVDHFANGHRVFFDTTRTQAFCANCRLVWASHSGGWCSTAVVTDIPPPDQAERDRRAA